MIQVVSSVTVLSMEKERKMHRTDFEKLDAELLAAANKVLTQRRGAYAADGDVLMNFKQVARETNVSTAKVWEIYFRKALNALRAVVEGGESAGESRLERAVDALNYVRLGWAIANEYFPRAQQPEPTNVVGSIEELMRAELQSREEIWRVDTRPQHAANRYVD